MLIAVAIGRENAGAATLRCSRNRTPCHGRRGRSTWPGAGRPCRAVGAQGDARSVIEPATEPPMSGPTRAARWRRQRWSVARSLRGA
jgi:hypothetical protein